MRFILLSNSFVVSVMLIRSHVEALTAYLPRHDHHHHPAAQQKNNNNDFEVYHNPDDIITNGYSRRIMLRNSFRFLVGTAAATGCSWGFYYPSPALALKERNEQLCGTGFFTNIWEYRCTDIGDISDEASRVGFSQKEETAAESLMAKFNLETTDVKSKREENGAIIVTDPEERKDSGNDGKQEGQ